MTSRISYLAVAILAAASPVQAGAETVAPRQTVSAIAEKIASTYFDEAKAKRIAAELDNAARKGEFDRYRDPAALASAVTARIAGQDGHFNVHWSPPSANTAPSAPPPEADPEVLGRRSGYGFRSVEILPGNIGYINLTRFEPIDFSNPDWPPLKAANAALGLIDKTSAVIIDLRDNGGGDPSMVGYIASAFVAPDADVYSLFKSRQFEGSERPPAPYKTPMLDKPVYVLTSGRTGSAAEGLAYTLQQAKRAVVVGQKSYGAANSGDIFDVGNGFSVFIPVATPINPITKSNWEGAGVTPDVAVPSENALSEAHRKALETVLPTLPPEEKKDSQWALDALKAPRTALDAATLSRYAGRYGTTLEVVAKDGILVINQARRLPRILVPLESNLFFVEGDPSSRVTFQTDAAGKVTGLEQSWSDGSSASVPRA